LNISGFTADTSSLILLSKAELITKFSSAYRIFTTKSAVKELEKQNFDKRIIKQLIIDPLNNITDKDIIAIWQKNKTTALLADDLKILQPAINSNSHYLSAIVIPYILNFNSLISKKVFEYSINWLTNNGYYSEKVLKKAKSFNKNLPQWMKNIEMKIC